MNRRHVLSVVGVAIAALVLLHASRFWPDSLQSLGIAGDDWLHAALPTSVRVFSIPIWLAASFAVLSLAQKLINLAGGKR